ncbi:endogenous retroviral envelope protein HEMO-like [Pelodiscus sinensis]|uniref:endogenous retroviral envelope protein HEMO-like n=1 Tax=Pelodiscus sinensis TaxID=13735 RepID=UPI003F6CB421
MTPDRALLFLLITAISAVPEHPLRNAIQTIASAADATNCWICTLLGSPTGLGVEFVPLNLNDWWNKSNVFKWGPAWFDDSSSSDYKLLNDSGKGTWGWHGQWQPTLWGQPLEYITGTSREVYPICFENKNGTGPHLGWLGDQQCTHIVSFNKKLKVWDVYPSATHQKPLRCGGYNISHSGTPLSSNVTIIPLNFSQYLEGKAWYNQSLFIIPNTGQIYNPTLVTSNTLLPNQCARTELFAADQVLQDLLLALHCTAANDSYCATHHTPKKEPTGTGWYKGPYSPILKEEPGLFFICRQKAYKYLPLNWMGRCSMGHAAPEGLTVHPHIMAPGITNLGSFLHRSPRRFSTNPLIIRPTGFHQFVRALLPWLGVAELEKAIVNVSGQIEQALNHTADALGLLNEQIQSVARFALQNRIALDAVLAQQGGVCAVINQSCCFYVNKSGQIEQDVLAIKGAVKVLHAVTEDGKASWLDWLAQHLGFSLTPFLHSIVNTILTVLLVVIACCMLLCIVKRLVYTATSSVQVRYMALGSDPNQSLDPKLSDQTLPIGRF